MGACEYENIGTGKSAREVFRKLVEEAEWNHGHAGYTGTIAEKDSFIEFMKPT